MPVTGLDRQPPDPYVRDPRDMAREWHIAVGVMVDGSVMLRCRMVPLPGPHEWRSDPPEISIGAVACELCTTI